MGALQITLKDLRLLARDKRAAMILLLLPLTFIWIIGGTTGQLMSAREGGSKVTVGVVNLSDVEPGAAPADEAEAEVDPTLAEEVIAEMSGHDHFEVTIMESEERAMEALDRGRAIVVMIIGPDFEQRVDALELADIMHPKAGPLREGPASLDLKIRSKPSLAKLGTLAAAVIYGDVVRIIAPHVASDTKNVFVRNTMRVAENKARKAEEEQGEVKTKLLDLVEQEKKPSSVVFETVVPAYTVLFVFFLVNFMARSFVAERELGTLKRLRMAPISAPAVLIGKNVPFYILSLIQTSMLFLFGRILFGMSWGVEPWLLLPIIACTSLAATSLGLLVATLIRTDAQVSAYANGLVLVLGGISGCFMPREWMPPLMQNVSLGTPHAWALIAYDEVLTHKTIDHTIVAKSCGMLLAFSALFFALGWMRYRMRDE